MVGDRVQNRRRPLGQLLRRRLQALADGAERAVAAVPDGDDEVIAGERHQLAGLHDLARRGELLVLHVAHGLEDGEQYVVVPLHLGALVRVHGVLDGERVQAEQLGEPGELLLRRFVQADPDEPVARLADPPQRLLDLGAAVLPGTVHVDHAVDHRAAERGAGRVTQIDGPPVAATHGPAQVAEHGQRGTSLRRFSGQSATVADRPYAGTPQDRGAPPMLPR